MWCVVLVGLLHLLKVSGVAYSRCDCGARASIDAVRITPHSPATLQHHTHASTMVVRNRSALYVLLPRMPLPMQHLHLTEPYRAMLGVLRGELDRGSMKASALSSAVRDLAAGKHSTRQQQQLREREREEREREVVLVDEEGAGQRAAGQGGRQGQRQGQGQGQQEGAGAREVLLHPRLLTDMLLMARPPGEVCEACGREHNSDDSVSGRGMGRS